MKNKTTYEMEDVMNLITKDLADKGLTIDSASIEVWARVDGARISTKEIEVDINVSWVGISTQEDGESSPSRARSRRVVEPDTDVKIPSSDLLDEAPRPGTSPVLEIGIDEVTAASTRISRAGGAGPFASDRVKRRLSDDESSEWPGNPSQRGR